MTDQSALIRLEGRWNGEATVIAPGHLPEVRVVSAELTYDGKDGKWKERQSLTDAVGLTSTQVLSLDMVCTVICTDGCALFHNRYSIMCQRAMAS